MKFSSSEEYGLRCMLQMAKKGPQGTATIQELAQKEGMTSAYVAKIHVVTLKAEFSRELFLTVSEYLQRTMERPFKTIEYYLKVLPLDKSSK